MNRPKTSAHSSPALPKPEACSTRSRTPSADTAKGQASRPKIATNQRAVRTFWASVMPGRRGTITLCETSEAETRSALSAVERIAETIAPAKTT